jgi:hypothetical protein
MAHFAELDESNLVVRVIVVGNDDCLDQNGVESEAVGVAFCENLLGGTWVHTSYNSTFLKNYAGIGFTYDVQRNAFIPPKPPGDKWVLDEETCLWFDPEVLKVNATIGVSRV